MKVRPSARAAGVRALLDAHAAAIDDPVERGFVDEMGALLGASDPFARDHFVPGHFTASAFVTRVRADGVSLLLVLHGKLHRWLQPGGHFEPDDADLFAAARREVAEETGLTDVVADTSRLLDVDVHEIPFSRSTARGWNSRSTARGWNSPGDPPHRHYDLRVHLRARADADAVAGSDARAIRWVPLSADAFVGGPHPEAGFDGSDASVMRAVRRLRRITG